MILVRMQTNNRKLPSNKPGINYLDYEKSFDNLITIGLCHCNDGTD